MKLTRDLKHPEFWDYDLTSEEFEEIERALSDSKIESGAYYIHALSCGDPFEDYELDSLEAILWPALLLHPGLVIATVIADIRERNS